MKSAMLSDRLDALQEMEQAAGCKEKWQAIGLPLNPSA